MVVSCSFQPYQHCQTDLQWESSIEINPGIDFGFFYNRITGSVEYYERTSEKLLIDNPVSSTTGFSSALVNLGKVKNSGLEFEIRTKNVTSENFSWNSTVLLSANDNELVSFGDLTVRFKISTQSVLQNG